MIPTVTKPFCGDCDRVRLTADGQFRTCLFATDEFDMRDALRNGETDDEIARRIEAAVGTKWAGHQINQVNFIRPQAHDEPDRRLTCGAAAVPVGDRRRGRRHRGVGSGDGAQRAGHRRHARRTTAGVARRSARSVGGCDVFPADNPWNTEISGAPLRSDSSRSSPPSSRAVEPASTPTSVRTRTTASRTSSCRRRSRACRSCTTRTATRAIPARSRFRSTPRSRVGRDRRATATCSSCSPVRANCSSCSLRLAAGRVGRAASGARFDLSSNELRPLGWTSADAAGLPILPGLVRYDEVAAGEIRHTIRVTFSRTRRGYVLPATHAASSSTDPTLPPMGLRLRLKASFDVTSLSGQARTIAVAMQRYGLIVADNGSNWFFQGAPSAGWDDDDLGQLKSISGTEFEVVDTGPVRT